MQSLEKLENSYPQAWELLDLECMTNPMELAEVSLVFSEREAPCAHAQQEVWAKQIATKTSPPPSYTHAMNLSTELIKAGEQATAATPSR